MSVDLEEVASDDAELEPGGCVGIGDVQARVPIVLSLSSQGNTDGVPVIQIAGSISSEGAEQRPLKKQRIKARDPEVSSSLNTQQVLYRIILDLSVLKGRMAESAGGKPVLSSVNYNEGLKPVEARLCHYCESKGNYRLIRVCFKPRIVTFGVSGLVEVDWDDFMLKRKGMETHCAIFMAAESLSVMSCCWYEMFCSWLMAGVVVVCIAMERLYVGQVRITTLSLFSGAVHSIHLGLNMYLFSGKKIYTVLIRIKHVLVQCVLEHCSFLGWGGDSTICYMDDCVFLTLIMIIVLLEFIPSKNLSGTMSTCGFCWKHIWQAGGSSKLL